MNPFIVLLDGQIVDEPEGLEDYAEEIVRDEERRIMYYNLPAQLRFVGSGYGILEAKYQQSYNSEVNVTIIDNRGQSQKILTRGVIKMSNCEFYISDLPKRSVAVEIDDNVFQAQILQQLDRKFGVQTTVSTNNVEIDPATPIDLTVFNVDTGANLPDSRRAFDVFECMRVAIAFLTDNNVEFKSDWYDDLPDDQRLCILSGIELRAPGQTGEIPVISLQLLFDELWKKYNLYLIVETPNNAPTIRLEEESYFYKNQQLMQLHNIEGLRRKLDLERLFNRLIIGSQDADRVYDSSFSLPYITFINFTREEFNVSGTINVNNPLELLSRFVIDNNKIEDALNNNEGSQDEDIFMIQYDQTTNTATKGTYFDGPLSSQRLYNEQLLNSNVAARFNLLGDIVLNIGITETSFRASLDDSFTGIVAAPNQGEYQVFGQSLIEIDDDTTPPNFDDNNVFDTATHLWTCPAGAGGIYRFRVEYEMTYATGNEAFRFAPRPRFNVNGNTAITVQYFAEVYNPSDTLLFSGYVLTGQPAPPNVQPGSRCRVRGEFSFVIAAGDTVGASAENFVVLSSSSGGSGIFTTSDFVFSLPVSPLSGGTYQENDPDVAYVGVYEIDEVGITQEQWEEVKEDPTRAVIIDTGAGDFRKAYIRSMERETITGKSQVELIFNRKQPIK